MVTAWHAIPCLLACAHATHLQEHVKECFQTFGTWGNARILTLSQLEVAVAKSSVSRFV